MKISKASLKEIVEKIDLIHSNNKKIDFLDKIEIRDFLCTLYAEKIFENNYKNETNAIPIEEFQNKTKDLIPTKLKIKKIISKKDKISTIGWYGIFCTLIFFISNHIYHGKITPVNFDSLTLNDLITIPFVMLCVFSIILLFVSYGVSLYEKYYEFKLSKMESKMLKNINNGSVEKLLEAQKELLSEMKGIETKYSATTDFLEKELLRIPSKKFSIMNVKYIVDNKTKEDIHGLSLKKIDNVEINNILNNKNIDLEKNKKL